MKDRETQVSRWSSYQREEEPGNEGEGCGGEAEGRRREIYQVQTLVTSANVNTLCHSVS